MMQHADLPLPALAADLTLKQQMGGKPSAIAYDSARRRLVWCVSCRLALFPHSSAASIAKPEVPSHLHNFTLGHAPAVQRCKPPAGSVGTPASGGRAHPQRPPPRRRPLQLDIQRGAEAGAGRCTRMTCRMR